MTQGRAKRPHQKVKTGCITCRQRRIKCDEAKPACQQCTGSLRKCEGYQPPRTWLFKPRASFEKLDNKPITQVLSPLTCLGNTEDKRSFQFWIERGAPLFSCYFAHSYWTTLLPQIGMAHPAVKHLMLASSSLLESLSVDGPVSSQLSTVYHHHYAKAVEATVSSAQIELVLTAALLFACCEYMRNEIRSATVHISSGLYIIEEWFRRRLNLGQKSSKEALLIVHTLGPVFLSYADKAPTYGLAAGKIERSPLMDLMQPNIELPHVGNFTEPHRPFHCLDGIGHLIAREVDWTQKAWATAPRSTLQRLLRDWLAAFNLFEDRMKPSHRRRFGPAMRHCRIMYHMFNIMLRASIQSSETAYLDYDKDFTKIVDYYDDITQAWIQDDPSQYLVRPGDIDVHMGFIPPLFFTATKCRNLGTRLRALGHLHLLRVTENNWTSCTAYKIAKSIIQIENANAFTRGRPREVDQQDLIRTVEVVLSNGSEDRAIINYVRYPYSGDSVSVEQDIVELTGCSASSRAIWPLQRIVRVGGYQGGCVTPESTGCDCGSAPTNGLPSPPAT